MRLVFAIAFVFMLTILPDNSYGQTEKMRHEALVAKEANESAERRAIIISVGIVVSVAAICGTAIYLNQPKSCDDD